MMDHGKEIVALAAKAAGIELACWDEVHHQWYRMTDDPEKVRQTGNGYGSAVFDPLDDDGDALRLAIALGLEIYEGSCDDQLQTWVGWSLPGKRTYYLSEYHGKDRYLAARRAIVRAAAEIGKAIL
jgi:hypothetical protein